MMMVYVLVQLVAVGTLVTVCQVPALVSDYYKGKKLNRQIAGKDSGMNEGPEEHRPPEPTAN
jgi:hypothetical protein